MDHVVMDVNSYYSTVNCIAVRESNYAHLLYIPMFYDDDDDDDDDGGLNYYNRVSHWPIFPMTTRH
jgi:hypothetical protein